MTIIRFVHFLSLVIWIGGMIFFSFIAAPSIFKALPRETAGDVVGNIFPKYWLMGYLCSITSLITIIMLSYMERSYSLARIGLLVLMMALTFYSGLVVGAKAREVKAQIRMVEDTSKKEILKSEFNTLHKRSTVLNIAILILGLAVIFLTAYKREL